MQVRVRSASYVGTVYEQLPPLPEIAFVGRSNVGKSSLINALLGRRSLVKTSKQPGKTRNVNFFQVDLVERPSLYLVDLPGYGYAQVSREMRQSWEGLVRRYLRGNTNLRLILVLVDLRRELREEEFIALKMARDQGARAVVVATKADKLGQSERLKQIQAITAQAGMDPVVTSASKGAGLDALWEEMLAELLT